MKIAIPMAQGKLCPHFGHCETFVLIDVDKAEKKILSREDIESPPHQPGMLPGWLNDRGVNMIVAGGMGVRAQQLFTQMNIEVLVGAPPIEPEEVVKAWMDDSLTPGDNVCDHEPGASCDH